jgi:hypothetical protein
LVKEEGVEVNLPSSFVPQYKTGRKPRLCRGVVLEAVLLLRIADARRTARRKGVEI